MQFTIIDHKVELYVFTCMFCLNMGLKVHC